jgi:hypothetical protein
MSGGYNHCYYMVTWNVELMTFGSKLAHIFYYFAMSTSPCEVSQGFFFVDTINAKMDFNLLNHFVVFEWRSLNNLCVYSTQKFVWNTMA